VLRSTCQKVRAEWQIRGLVGYRLRRQMLRKAGADLGPIRVINLSWIVSRF